VYLMLQQRSHIASTFFPLFYLATACWYMVLSIPAGWMADRWGRTPVLLAGYSAVGAIYLILIAAPDRGLGAAMLCLFLFGLHYAATEGVLTAMASALIPAESRTTGLAIVASCIGFGKMGSSVVFGWVWQTWGAQVALSAFAAALAVAVLIAVALLGGRGARA
jgi:MFS family permease